METDLQTGATSLIPGMPHVARFEGLGNLESLAAGQVRFAASGQPGDTAQGRLTLTVIRNALAEVAERRGDANLHYLDGTELYGEADPAAHPLPDALHPDTDTHALIGSRFAERAFGTNGPLAGG